MSSCGTAAKTAENTAKQTTRTEAITTEEITATETKQTGEKKYIALTFDDGPNTGTTVQVLDVLEKHGVVASFFLVGDNINGKSVKSVERAVEMGCEINNHSRTHSDMTKMTAEEIKAEIKFTNERIAEITGAVPRFFRPPYIAVNDALLDAVDLTFISGVGCNDWEDSVSAETRVKTITAQARDGMIILMHDMEGNSQTVEAIDRIIPELLGQGYEFVTVSRLFELEGVETDGQTKFIYSNALQTTMY